MPSAYTAPLINATFPSDGVLVLALARPPVNAFSTDLFHQLEQVFRVASGDNDVHCVVLTSDVAKGFTAGLDLQCVSRLPSSFPPPDPTLPLRLQLERPHAPSRRPGSHCPPPARRTPQTRSNRVCLAAVSLTSPRPPPAHWRPPARRLGHPGVRQARHHRRARPVPRRRHRPHVGRRRAPVRRGQHLRHQGALAPLLPLPALVPPLTARSHSQEVDIGLAADIGSLQRLPLVTGNASLVAELALTARNFGPDEAEKLGLVSRVVSGGEQGVKDEAIRLAKVIASASLAPPSPPPRLTWLPSRGRSQASRRSRRSRPSTSSTTRESTRFRTASTTRKPGAPPRLRSLGSRTLTLAYTHRNMVRPLSLRQHVSATDPAPCCRPCCRRATFPQRSERSSHPLSLFPSSSSPACRHSLSTISKELPDTCRDRPAIQLHEQEAGDVRQARQVVDPLSLSRRASRAVPPSSSRELLPYDSTRASVRAFSPPHREAVLGEQDGRP